MLTEEEAPMNKAMALLLAAVALGCGGEAVGDEEVPEKRGTPDEARAMLGKAITHYAKVGREKALADFTAGKAPFHDRDLYVVCIGVDHTIIAHGGFAAFVGQSADRLANVDGKPLGNTLWSAASDAKEGAVRYRWINPMSGQPEPKVSFARKAGNDVCLVGAYNP
jgi:cytochrome c